MTITTDTSGQMLELGVCFNILSRSRRASQVSIRHPSLLDTFAIVYRIRPVMTARMPAISKIVDTRAMPIGSCLNFRESVRNPKPASKASDYRDETRNSEKGDWMFLTGDSKNS